MPNSESSRCLPLYCLTLHSIVISEDRRGEGLGSDLADSVGRAMLDIVADNLPKVTKRGAVDFWFRSEIVSVSGWLAASLVADYLEYALELDSEESGFVGKFCSRPASLEVSLED